MFCIVGSYAIMGLETIQYYTFWGLADVQKILSKGKAFKYLVGIADLTFQFDFTITLPLHDVDLILGINWL